MENKTKIIILVVAIVASAGITRYYFPKVEYKNVEVTKEVVHNNVQTIIKEVVKPDGTKETTTEITDTSTKTDMAKNETISEAKSQWMFDVGARENFSDRDIFYDLQVQRRILGPFFLGVKASTDKSVGVSLGMEF